LKNLQTPPRLPPGRLCAGHRPDLTHANTRHRHRGKTPWQFKLCLREVMVPLEGDTLNSLFTTLAEWNRELEEIDAANLLKLDIEP
jgi:hypothetical protein